MNYKQTTKNNTNKCTKEGNAFQYDGKVWLEIMYPSEIKENMFISPFCITFQNFSDYIKLLYIKKKYIKQ